MEFAGREGRLAARHAVKALPFVYGRGRNIEGETINMSLSGMLVRARRPLAPGTRVQMNLHLAPGRKPITGHGSLVRFIGRTQMGIHIERLDSRAEERLEEFLLPLIPEAN